jgi:hypothetical protein
MTARSAAGTTEGLYLAVKGGHNREHHNHNDVGNFIVYADGLPVIIDVGAGTYTAQNSGPGRYDIWNMHSGYHNLPTINTIRQGYGEEFSATVLGYSADERSAQLTLELARAYPPEAGLKTWTRRLTLNRGQDIQLEESYALIDPAQAITLRVLTPCETTESNGILHLHETRFDDIRNSGCVNIQFDPGQLRVDIEAIEIEDKKIQSSWGQSLYRILFIAENPPLSDTWVLRVTKS